MSLVGFGVKNLRCLTDTGIVPIKPITLLVGRNSSGKSTFLRAFPLLRQSVENARRSPILWFHKDFVDFGNIDTAINERAAERSVTFAFAIESDDGARELGMTIASAPEGPYVSSYDLRGTVKARLDFDPAHRLVGLDNERRSAIDLDDVWQSGSGYLIASVNRVSGPPVYQAFNGDHVSPRPNAFAPHVSLGPLPGPPRLPPILRTLRLFDQHLTAFVHGVAYLGPHRAIAQRFHRQTEAAVEMVDASGENIADFLASLTPSDWKSLQAFTKQYLGFEPFVRREGMNVEILVKQTDAEPFKNIADVGFGYAEVLPLCAALWSSCVRTPSPARRQVSLLAIEQPELHLHPAHQARLADMLLGALPESRKAGREVKLMVETHSEALVNGLGDLVEAKVLSPDDVQIVLFDQDPETRQTKLRFAGYDADGALHDWPFGFFAPVKENPFAVGMGG